MRTRTYTLARTSAHFHTDTHPHTDKLTDTQTHRHAHRHTQAHTSTHTHTHTHTHTRTHTHTHSPEGPVSLQMEGTAPSCTARKIAITNILGAPQKENVLARVLQIPITILPRDASSWEK